MTFCNVFTDLELNHLDTFCTTTKSNSWVTVAQKIDNLVFVGCNEGSIYLYKLNKQVCLKIMLFILNYEEYDIIY